MSRHRALITGASAGIGRELARQLAAMGKDLILVARREEQLQALANELGNAYGVDIEVIPADLSDPDAPALLYEETRRRNLDVDYLINNAGSSGPDLLRNRSWSDSGTHLQLMTTSVAAMCHFFIPPMRERRFGRVLNVASVAGLLTVSGDYSYGPTKAYLVALSKGLSATLKSEGINVTALCPGFTHTEFHASEKLQKMKRSMPGFIWYDAEVVVREGLRALEKGRAVYISGRLYRFTLPILRLLPGRFLASAFGVKR